MSQSAKNINVQIADWYKRFHNDLLIVGQQLGYSGEELNDLLHQFFLNLMERQTDMSAVINPRSYLQIAFKRRLIDHYRSEKRYLRNQSMYVVQDDFQPSVQELIEKAQENSVLIEIVRNTCKKLPATCRTIILLKYGEGLSNEEIEKRTGLSRRTIYNSLFKSIKILRRELSDTPFPVFFTLLPLLISLCGNDIFPAT